MFDKQKFKSSLKYIALAISLAFTGPIIFILKLKEHETEVLNTLFHVVGLFIMLGALYFGFKGIKKMLESFFDHPNE